MRLYKKNRQNYISPSIAAVSVVRVYEKLIKDTRMYVRAANVCLGERKESRKRGRTNQVFNVSRTIGIHLLLLLFFSSISI